MLCPNKSGPPILRALRVSPAMLLPSLTITAAATPLPSSPSPPSPRVCEALQICSSVYLQSTAATLKVGQTYEQTRRRRAHSARKRKWKNAISKYTHVEDAFHHPQPSTLIIRPF